MKAVSQGEVLNKFAGMAKDVSSTSCWVNCRNVRLRMRHMLQCILVE